MKNCPKCNVLKDLDMFSVNDYGRPVSYCKECMRLYSVKRYEEKRKLKLAQSEVGTDCLSSGIVNEKVSKCKDFFFYA